MERRTLIRLVVAANALVILPGVAFYFHPDWPLFGGGHYYDEGGPMTALSLVQLAAIAVVAYRIHGYRRPAGEPRDARHSAYIGALIAYALLVPVRRRSAQDPREPRQCAARVARVRGGGAD